MAVSLAPGLLKLLSSLCIVGLLSTEIFLGIGKLDFIGVPGLLGIGLLGVSSVGVRLDPGVKPIGVKNPGLASGLVITAFLGVCMVVSATLTGVAGIGFDFSNV